MLGARMLSIPLAGRVMFGVASAAGSREAAITAAAVAPYRDVLLRDARALCSDVTPGVAATLVVGAPPGASCERAVQQVFASTAASQPPWGMARTLRATAGDLTINGHRAA